MSDAEKRGLEVSKSIDEANKAIEENIKNMLQENTSTILDIQALDMSEAMQAFKSFSDRNLLKKVS